MSQFLRLIVLAGCALPACAVFVVMTPPIVNALASSAHERGASDFHTLGCVRCHSITGVGGSRAPDLGSVGLRKSARQIRRQILHGGHGMPPFARVLSSAEVDDLAAFLRSCRSDDPPGCREWETDDSSK